MGMPQSPDITPVQSGDLAGLLAQLEQIVGPVAPPKPRYRPGYRPPKKPKLEELWGKSTIIKQQHQRLLDRFESDKMWLTMALVGLFEDDIAARNQGMIVDEFQSTGIVSDWNMVCAYLSSLPFSPIKKSLRDDGKVDARMVQDAVKFLYDEETARFAEQHGVDLQMEHARYLTIYGRLIDRDIINLSDPDYPRRTDLINPETAFFRESGNGIEEAYHRYRTTYRELAGTFGEPTAKEMRALRDKFGSDEWEDMEVEALDYWDTWFRAVVTDCATFMPVTEHKYGIVPFNRVYGPYGLPVAAPSGSTSHYSGIAVDRSSNAPRATQFEETDTKRESMVHQGVSYIHYMRKEHMQFEAVMARMLTAFKKAINPPLVKARAMEAADQPMRPINTGPGAVNEILLGAEEVNPIQTVASPIEVNTILTALTQEQRGTRLPPMLGGFNEQSNVSGTAQGGLADAGMEKVVPWQRSLERYHSSRFAQWLGLWRNFGHMAEYAGGGERQPFMVPRSRPTSGEAPVFELTREVIDRAGTRIKVVMHKPRTQQLLPLVNAYGGMVDRGWATDDMAMEALGFTDHERIRQEWIEDKALKQALEHPRFVEGFTIPLALREALKEAAGDPVAEEGFRAAIDWWMSNVAQPAQMQQEMQMQQAMAPPQVPQGGMVQPNTTAGISLPDATGQAPGSMTGVQGGQPPPPPPGSQVIPPGQPLVPPPGGI